MNRELKKFIKTYLSLEQAYDTSGHLEPTLKAFSATYVGAVQAGLGEVLRSRDLSVGEYEKLTDIEFADEEVLHEYLTALYAYLFEGAEEQPSPPE